MRRLVRCGGVVIAALVAGLLGDAMVWGDEAGPKGPGVLAKGYFMVGGDFLDAEPLNSRLTQSGYTEMSGNLLSLGGGGHAVLKRFIIGGEGHGLIGAEQEVSIPGGDYKTTLSAGYAFFDLGYLLISAGDLHIYPLLGLGGGALTFEISETGDFSFDDVLADPVGRAQLTTGSFLVNLSLGADYMWKIGEGETGEGGFVLGIRGGYTFAPAKGDWMIGDTEVVDGPEIGITGPYVRLVIGGGGVVGKQ